MIKISNLHKSYGRQSAKIEVLKGIDLAVPDGKILCVLGPSGSGKSTLLNVLGGIETIDAGEVEMDNTKLSKLSKRELELYRRHSLGFIFQFYNLISNLNVMENIEVGKFLAREPLETNTLLEELGLTEHKYKYPNQISGGQAQRTSIGRAIIKRPKLLICDEPTGALDYASAKDVLMLIEKLNCIYGTTVVIATHNVQIAKMCDLVLSLHSGEVKEFWENNAKIKAKDVTW